MTIGREVHPLAAGAAGLQGATSNSHLLAGGHREEALAHWHHGLESGRPWADVLLETVGLWEVPSEKFQGRHFSYLILGESFDWLLLAERLLLEAPGAVPLEEQERLLFYIRLPEHVTEGQFQECLGVAKYRAHLNYFYGVMVEEALMVAAEQEVLKEGGSRGFVQGHGVDDLVARRLYGDDLEALLQRFYGECGWPHRRTLTLGEWKAFLYWLSKLRVRRSDQARTASDLRKGLRQLSAALAPRLPVRVSIPAGL